MAPAVKLGAAEIVKLLPGISPGLSDSLLRALRRRQRTSPSLKAAALGLDLKGSKVQELVEEVCQEFGSELQALVAGEEHSPGGDGGPLDVSRQLAFCLFLALAPSLPNVFEIWVHDGTNDQASVDGGEQAAEVLYSALASQDWSSTVRDLRIRSFTAFGTDGACVQLAKLLESPHCKLQLLQMWGTATGAGGVRHIARALGTTNSSLTLLEIAECPIGDGGVEHLGAMLRTNSTLEELVLYDIGMTAVGLRYLCAALSQQPQGSSPRTVGLKTLEIRENKFGQRGVTALLGAMLASNRCLLALRVRNCGLREDDGKGHLAEGLRENSTLEELDICCNQLSKMALGPLVRCLTTGNKTLKTLKMHRAGELPAAEELAGMITSNQSLLEIDLREASYSARDWAYVILPALGRNKTLLSIDLWGCPGVQGDQVLSALFDLLRNNITIEEIQLSRTPLNDAGKTGAVAEEVGRNAGFRRALNAMPKAKPRSCRIVLCGHAYSGKSSLSKSTRMLVGDEQAVTSPSGQSKPTQGIEVDLLRDEEDLRISIWDLAGRRQFHALHHYMFPNGNNAATLFVLTVSPIVSPTDRQRAGMLRSYREMEEDLLYWLRFVTSNIRPSPSPPSVVVVITNKDRLQKLADLDSWLGGAEEVVAGLAEKFSSRLNVRPEPLVVNALATDDVELRRWEDEVEELEYMLRSTCDGLEDEPAICSQVLKAVLDVSQRTSSPIISRAEFANICRSVAPDVEAQVQARWAKAREDKRAEDEAVIADYKMQRKWEAEDEVGNVGVDEESAREVGAEDEDEKKNLNSMTQGLTLGEAGVAVKAEAEAQSVAAIGNKVWSTVAACLHNAGEIVYHEKLNFIIAKPRWLCQGVLGQLFDLSSSAQGQARRRDRSRNGLLTRDDLSSVLRDAAKSVPGLDPRAVTVDQLAQIMIAMDLCYEQSPGNPNTGYIVPALFE